MTMNNKDHMRFNMIEQQIRPWNVLNQKVLNAFDVINRDDFVSEEHKTLAFSELRLPLSGKDLMLTPAMEGRILQEIEIEPTDNVLVVGSGSGFLAALAAHLGEKVTAIDINPAYTVMAQKNIDQLNISNVTFVTADVKDFAVEKNSYDAIIMTGSVLEVPQKLLDALTVGGRLFSFIGQQDQTVTSGTLFKNELNEIRELSRFEIELERLHGFEDKPQFVF
ncbi:protein-L-isoaspartate O-methyltransferase family protein [Wohlfahrtiimonas larvae]|uniref:Protein-L-isoaspartate O-methyltransferase n=1 Tax=Wohlfahrtiimonas larvae TaxID=1157986 RepID=A0ABP9N2E7_9GAMM|nr:protein-L-isoaspartate O-methyltransferase [Wohlfahrtiimonas larvae]